MIGADEVPAVREDENHHQSATPRLRDLAHRALDGGRARAELLGQCRCTARGKLGGATQGGLVTWTGAQSRLDAKTR